MSSPLTTRAALVLALSHGAATVGALQKRVIRATGGAVRLPNASAYPTMEQLLLSGDVVETGALRTPDASGRTAVCFALTPQGAALGARYAAALRAVLDAPPAEEVAGG